MCMGFVKGTMVYRPYNTRRLESLTVCRWLHKGRTFSSAILRVLVQPGVCSSGVPPAQQTSAYSIELTGRQS